MTNIYSHNIAAPALRKNLRRFYVVKLENSFQCIKMKKSEATSEGALTGGIFYTVRKGVPQIHSTSKKEVSESGSS